MIHREASVRLPDDDALLVAMLLDRLYHTIYHHAAAENSAESGGERPALDIARLVEALTSQLHAATRSGFTWTGRPGR